MYEFKINEDITKVLLQNNKDKKLSLLFFTAKWCKPCKSIYTFIKNLSEAFKNKNANIEFYKVDIELHEEFVEKYNIKVVPTFYMMDGVTKLEEFSGVDIAKISKLVTSNLLKYNKENNIIYDKENKIKKYYIKNI